MMELESKGLTGNLRFQRFIGHPQGTESLPRKEKDIVWAQSIMNNSGMYNKTGYEEVYVLVCGMEIWTFIKWRK